jgi:hypothetical protein
MGTGVEGGDVCVSSDVSIKTVFGIEDRYVDPWESVAFMVPLKPS